MPVGTGRARGVASTVVMALAAAAVIACAPSGGTGTPERGMPPTGASASDAADALPEGVTATVVQLRSDVADRQAQVRFDNRSGDDLVIASLVVDDPRFAEPISRVGGRESVVGPGRTVDVRVQLPAVDCATPDEATPVLDVRLRHGDDDRHARVPIGEAFPVLAALHREECVAERLAEAATVSLGAFTPGTPGEPAALALDIAPRGAGRAARVDGIRETNLLTFAAAPGAAAPVHSIGIEVTGHPAASTSVALPLVPARCDPHAVQEDKRGTVFWLEVTVDGEAGRVPLAASAELRGRLLAWVADWCGYGTQ